MTVALRKTENTYATREQWLNAAQGMLASTFFPLAEGAELPRKMACSCGFPWKTKNAIGQCFSPQASADGTTNMFVCPTQDEPVRVLDILLHEMGHAALGVEEKHGKKFKAFCKEVGLSGKATATVAEPGTALHDTLQAIARELGPYPHSAMVKTVPTKKKEKAGGGWIRMVSVNDEEYKVTVSPKQLEEKGAPRDPWGDEMKAAS